MTLIVWLLFISACGQYFTDTCCKKAGKNKQKTDIYLGIKRTDRQGTGEEALL